MLSFLLNFIRLYEFLIFVRVLLSWIPHDRNNPIIDIIYKITEPILLLCRELLLALFKLFNYDYRYLPIDFSPWLAILLLDFLVKPAVFLLASFLGIH